MTPLWGLLLFLNMKCSNGIGWIPLFCPWIIILSIFNFILQNLLMWIQTRVEEARIAFCCCVYFWNYYQHLKNRWIWKKHPISYFSWSVGRYGYGWLALPCNSEELELRCSPLTLCVVHAKAANVWPRVSSCSQTWIWSVRASAIQSLNTQTSPSQNFYLLSRFLTLQSL